MYKEVAFDPCCLRSFEYYSLLKQQFGFDRGRYVSADRRAWAQEAMTAVKQAGLSVIREKSVKNYLNKLSRSKALGEFWMAPDRPKTEHESWADWLAEQAQVRPFDVTISDPACVGRLDIDAINDGHAEWGIPASMSVPRSANNIVGAVLGLLHLSSSITLIDPYFRLADNRTLLELFTVLQATSVGSICIVSTVDTDNPEGVYQREYLGINRKGIRLDWVLAPNQFFHDRYLITDAGAVRAGHGFMSDAVKGTHADQVNLNLIGIAEAERTQRSLQDLLASGRANIVSIAD
ncbi:MAG TPA: hypothetical protein DEA92_15260 [Pseudomonas sp.]|jgi:hypothetical protein|nr:hypothetical protein [Pseudomonas sp.]|tara:strand:- start:1880 stop:2755 length:876 start_codon:yes stop_codon:yes gene_type:complete